MTLKWYILIFITCFSAMLGKNLSKLEQNSTNEISDKVINGFKYSATDRMNQFIFATSVLATIGGYQYDQKVKGYSEREGLLSSDLARAGDLYGGALGHWILWTTIVTHSKLKGESKKEVRAKLEFSALALLSNAFATYLLKFGVGRERPNNGALSFPSGHTSHSFTIAAVTNELYGGKAGTVAYLMATLSAVSRIHDKKHYVSDVVFGAGLGTVIGRGFSIQYHKNKETHVYLFPTNNGISLHLIF